MKKVYNVLVFGDPHDKPGRNKRRFAALGRFASWVHEAWGLSAVVSIGDFGSFDSLSHHETRGSKGDIERPPFHEELDSLDEALAIYASEAPACHNVPHYQTHGNHEHRVYLAADLNPKEMGDFVPRLEQVFARYAWRTVPYGVELNLWGVDFVHTILSRAGKPSTSEFPELLFARKSVNDTVVGHSHIANMVTFRKRTKRVRVVNVGTAMPNGERERYTPPSDCGWDYGAVLLRIQDRRILSVKFFDAIEIEQDFGD